MVNRALLLETCKVTVTSLFASHALLTCLVALVTSSLMMRATGTASDSAKRQTKALGLTMSQPMSATSVWFAGDVIDTIKSLTVTDSAGLPACRPCTVASEARFARTSTGGELTTVSQFPYNQVSTSVMLTALSFSNSTFNEEKPSS